MGINFNGTYNSSDILRIWSYRASLTFLILLLVAGNAVALYFVSKIENICYLYYSVVAVYVSLSAILIWAITTKRSFHRTGFWTFIPFSIGYLVGVLFFFLLENTNDLTSYVSNTTLMYICPIPFMLIIWFVSYIVDFKLIKRERLYIAFLVSNKSSFEEKIRSTLNEAKHKSETIDSNICFIIPPFGIANSIKACERFINGWFCQTDAVIYARMLDSDDSTFGYAFTNFTSRMNRHFLENDKIYDSDPQGRLTMLQKARDWNTQNSTFNSIETKKIISEYLSQTILIYVSCIYMYKNKYTRAVSVAEKIFDFNDKKNIEVDRIIQNLLAEAYLVAEQSEEQENRNFQNSLHMLYDCKKRLPYIDNSLKYKLALARVLFYTDNISESKKITKSIINPHGKYNWYVTINNAFYALYEKKASKMVSEYKKLIKICAPDKEEVEFSISFLEKEANEHSNDKSYLMFLSHGISYLSLYFEERKSKKIIKNIEDSFKNIDGYARLESMRKLIATSRGKLKILKMK